MELVGWIVAGSCVGVAAVVSRSGGDAARSEGGR